MNRKFNPVIAVGAALLLVGVVVLAVLAGKGGDDEVATQKVLVASGAIARGTTGAAASVEVKDTPVNLIGVGTYLNQDAVRSFVALRDIAAGEVISTSNFGILGQATAQGVTLPKGKQAIGIELGFAPGALRYVVPGNKVVVWASRKTGQNPIAATRVVLTNILVIATTPGAGTGAATATVPGPGNLDFLLAVSPREAQTLISAQASGDALYVTLADTGTS